MDAGITKWNARPRINIEYSPYLETIDKKELALENFVTPREQSGYKYLLNIPGHVCAYRLSLELQMGSVIFLVDCEYKLWFQKFLIPTNISENIIGHYIPIKQDFSNLKQVWTWCEKNPIHCKKIVENAGKFHEKYLTSSGMLTHLRDIIMKNCICSYVYPVNPFIAQLKLQQKLLTCI